MDQAEPGRHPSPVRKEPIMYTYEKSPDYGFSKDYILVPVYSDNQNEDGSFDILRYRREYI